jgi:predicted double-glycine peptidase
VISALVVLIAALSSAAWIDVPFTRQEKNGCGSASVWMLMEYWGMSSGSPEDLQRVLYSKEAGGIFASDMVTFLAGHGFQTVSFAGEWSDLAENINRGRPLVVTLEANSRGTPLHYVLVVGVDEARQFVLVNDPAQRKLLPISRSDFEKRWEAMNRWTLLAVPAAPIAPVSRSAPALPSRLVSSDPALEEASAAFRAGDLGTARQLLNKRDSDDDPLTTEFLATLYFLDDNLEAALRHWNRNGSPLLRDVQMDFPTRWDPVRLENTVGISRATVLRDSDYVLARKRLDASGAFSGYAFDLNPVEGRENEFDLRFRASERPRWSPIGWFSQLPYQTVSPDVRNLGGGGINIESLWRWDVNKRRVLLRASGPASVSTRYQAELDARNEIWERHGQTIPVRKDELHVGLRSVATPRWSWSSGALITRRPSGFSLKYEGATAYDLLRLSDRRLTVKSEARGQFGRAFSTPQRITRGEGGIRMDWLPRSKGEDYHVMVRARAGRVWGTAYVDELFSVGIDRDDDLWLRGHSTTREGRKGAGLTTRRYILWNGELSKTLFEKAFFKASLVPFADVARVGSIYVDAGAELRFSFTSVATFSVSVGRDLKAGRTLVFTNATR